MQSKQREFASRLLTWHAKNKADFPWRYTADPYKILVSEILLQKTTRNQVKKIFDQFFRKYPNFRALASDSQEAIKEVINPLGLEHRRAHALKEIAGIMMENYGGKVPIDKRKLLQLPRVGPYVANSVLCFAFGHQEPLLDTNVIRVVRRVFSLKAKKKRPRDDPEMWKAVGRLIPSGKATDFNLALLDFAAKVCLHKTPKCTECLMASICDQYKLAMKKTLHHCDEHGRIQ